MTIRYANLDERRKEVNQLLERKYLVEKLSFIDNQNINLNILKESGLYLNEYGTIRLVNSFSCNLIMFWDAICFDRNTIKKTNKTKNVNDNSIFNICVINNDRSIVFCPETHNNLIANKTTSRNKINNGISYPLAQAYRLKNPKNVMLGHLNVHSARNKNEAAEDLRKNFFFFLVFRD